jgi:hypothetical protein
MPRCPREPVMPDLFFIAGALALFALTVGYAYACERL